MKKSMLIMLVIIAMLLSGCMQNGEIVDTESTAATTETFPLTRILWTELPYEESLFYHLRDLHYSIDDRFDDEDLQEAVSAIEMEYPISTDEQIQTYAWELYEICISQGLFDAQFVPDCAFRFLEGMWYLSYCPLPEEPLSESRYYIYEGEIPDFLISGEDGHIIYYGFGY